jgi:hypothetical protein
MELLNWFRSHLVRSHYLTVKFFKTHKIYQSKSTPEEYNSDDDQATTNDSTNLINKDNN